MPSRQGKLWFFGVLLITALLLPSASARNIYPRAPSAAEEQVFKAIQALYNQMTTLVASPKEDLKKVKQDLKGLLGDRKLKVVFAMFAGTLGDVGKSEYYMDELDKTKEFDIQMVSDRRNDVYMANSFQQKYRKDIDRCGTDTPEAAFEQCFSKAMTEFQPDVVIRANPVYRAYDTGTKGLYAKLREPVDKCIKEQKCILIDIKAFWLPPDDMKKKSKEWNEYYFNEHEINVVGQIPFWYNNPDPAITHQVLVGHAGTYRDPDPLEQPLQKFINDAKNSKKRIMYLGQGAQLRPDEASMKKPTKALEAFYTTQLKEDESKSWKFIVLHNAQMKDKKDASDPPITNDGNVYHVWFPQNIPAIWNQVDLVLHHGGAGSFSDSIVSGVPQICMPQGDWSPDQKVWADLATKNGIGCCVAPIVFGKDYNGKELMDRFKEISADLLKRTENVQKFTDQYKDQSAARLTVEIIQRLSDARLERTKKCVANQGGSSASGTSAGSSSFGAACPQTSKSTSPSSNAQLSPTTLKTLPSLTSGSPSTVSTQSANSSPSKTPASSVNGSSTKAPALSTIMSSAQGPTSSMKASSSKASSSSAKATKTT